MANIRKFATLALATLAVTATQAQTVTVDKTGITAGSYTSIADALASSASEIVVKNTGVYNEGVLITRSVIVRGEDPNNRPVIAMKGLTTQPALGPGDGVFIGGDGNTTNDLDITFRDFILIPATSGGPTDDCMSVTPNPGALLKLNLTNVLCAPNDGSDKPLATSVWDNPDFNAPGVVRIPDDGIYLMDDQFSGFAGDIQATIKDVTFVGVGGSNAGGDAFVLYPGRLGRASLTLSGLGASYSSRYATQTSTISNLTVSGTRSNPGWVARKNGVGLIFFAAGDVTLDHVVATDNNDCGMRIDADSNKSLTMTNSFFAHNKFQGITIPYAPDAPKTFSISDTTFYNNDAGNNDIYSLELGADGTADLTVNVTDCIFAGSDSEAIQNKGAANVTAKNCAFVTAGPDALPGTVSNVTEIASVNADPQFVNTNTNPLSPTSFDVQNTAYATASSTGGRLNGWGDGPGSAVRDWSVY